MPELTETTEFIVYVKESLYAINIETDEEEIVESLTNFAAVIVEYIEEIVEEEEIEEDTASNSTEPEQEPIE